VKSKVVSAKQSPLNKKQWHCDLECGHSEWVTSTRKPRMVECSAQHHAHLTPESLASSQAVSNASALEQSDGATPPAQAQVA
jgi:hypothetical protein